MSERAKHTSKSYAHMRLGLFVHYVYAGRAHHGGVLGRHADGSPVSSLDELADGLDVQNLADMAAAMGAEYVQFTAWHANMNALYPSEVMASALPGHCSQRDVIADLLDALASRDIALILYVHPSDGHDFSPEDQERVGWNDGPPYRRWNDFINDVFAELVGRYAGRVRGYWVDGGLPPAISATISRLRETIREHDPAAEVVQNEGFYDCRPRWADYGSREVVRFPYPANRLQVTMPITAQWWADRSYLMIPPEVAFQYTVLQAAVQGSEGGGVAWNAGPYPNGRWEPGVADFVGALGGYVASVKEALLGTRPSRSFVTPPGTPLAGTRAPQAVATESRDGSETYVHVLNAPAGPTLDLPLPYDGRTYETAHLLHTEQQVELVQDEGGVHLTLSAASAWGELDTVIVLR